MAERRGRSEDLPQKKKKKDIPADLRRRKRKRGREDGNESESPEKELHVGKRSSISASTRGKEFLPLPPDTWNISLPGKRRRSLPQEIDYTHTGHTKS